MKFVVTSIAAEEVGKFISPAMVRIMDLAQAVVDGKSYGGDFKQFTAIFISIFDDPKENEPYCARGNKTGKYKDFFSGEVVKWIGVAVPVLPKVILDTPEDALESMLVGRILEELRAPAYKMPRIFQREKFLADMKSAFGDYMNGD